MQGAMKIGFVLLTLLFLCLVRDTRYTLLCLLLVIPQSAKNSVYIFLSSIVVIVALLWSVVVNSQAATAKMMLPIAIAMNLAV